MAERLGGGILLSPTVFVALSRGDLGELVAVRVPLADARLGALYG